MSFDDFEGLERAPRLQRRETPEPPRRPSSRIGRLWHRFVRWIRREPTVVDQVAERALAESRKSRIEDVDDLESERFVKKGRQGPSSEKILAERDSEVALFGMKAANLGVLTQVCQEIEHPIFKTQVPPFLKVSCKDVEDFLQKHYPNFKKDWEGFVDIQGSKKALTEVAIKQLQIMHKGIIDAFDNCSDEDLKFDIPKNWKVLTVRSTGIEDSKESSLAGANESITEVPTRAKAVGCAMGSVVASYLSKNSLSYRLQAGLNITAPPFFPVLIQQLVGREPKGKGLDKSHLPVCGVCYTRETGGNTPELVVIEAAYGHNTGVVNSEVDTDRYYIYAKGDTDAKNVKEMEQLVLIRKRERFVAHKTSSGENRFTFASNPSDAANSAALSKEARFHLAKVAQECEKTFGVPIDMEWIFDPKENTLYLVQARPIKETQVEEAVHVNWDRHPQNPFLFHGEMIVHKDGSAIVLSSPKQVIKAKSLQAAHNQFQEVDALARQKKKKHRVRLVVVEEAGGVLSHYACILRENRVPVIYCSDFDPISLTSKTSYALVDTQRGIIGQWNYPEGEIPSNVSDELISKSVLEAGWSSHPIAPLESVRQLRTLIPVLKLRYQALLKDHQLSIPSKELSLQNLLERLHHPNWKNSNCAMRDIVFVLTRILQVIQKGSYQGNAFHLNRFRLLLLNVMDIGDDLLCRKDRMQRLHAAKRVEALLLQDNTRPLLESDSLSLILNEHAILSELEDVKSNLKKKDLYQYKLYYHLVEKFNFTERLEKRWNSFTQWMLTSASQEENHWLCRFLQYLDRNDILEEWLTRSFADFALKEQDSHKVLHLCLQDGVMIIESLEEFQSLFENLTIREWNLGLWEDPKKFNKTWGEFESIVVEPLYKMSHQYCQEPPKNPLVTSVWLKQVLKGAEVFDHAIKSLRGSPRYSRSQKKLQVKRFRTMLDEYLKIMDLWFDLIPDEEFQNWNRLAINLRRDDMTPKKYRDNMKKVIHLAMEKTKVEPRELNPSSGFNVQAACVNSGARFFEIFHREERTLEDLFSLIHQNILASVQVHIPTVNRKRLPREMSQICKAMDEFEHSLDYFDQHYDVKATLLLQEITYPTIRLTYNLPIKLHSSRVTIVFHQHTKDWSLKLDIFGHNINQRMDLISYKFMVSGANQGCSFIDAPEYVLEKEQLSVTWKMERKLIPLVITMIKEMMQDTLLGNWGSFHIPDLQAEGYRAFLQHPAFLRKMVKLTYTQPSISQFIYDVLSQMIADEKEDDATTLIRALDWFPRMEISGRFSDALATLVIERMRVFPNNCELKQIGIHLVSNDPIVQFVHHQCFPPSRKFMTDFGKNVLEKLLENKAVFQYPLKLEESCGLHFHLLAQAILHRLFDNNRPKEAKKFMEFIYKQRSQKFLDKVKQIGAFKDHKLFNRYENQLKEKKDESY